MGTHMHVFKSTLYMWFLSKEIQVIFLEHEKYLNTKTSRRSVILFAGLGTGKFALVLNGPFFMTVGMTDGFAGDTCPASVSLVGSCSGSCLKLSFGRGVETQPALRATHGEAQGVE